MNDAEARLAVLWAADTPAARDALFRLDVMARLERRRFLWKAATLSLLGAATTGMVWMLAPQLSALDDQASSVLASLAGAASLVWGAFAVLSGVERRR